MTFSINDAQYCVIMLTIGLVKCYAECRYAERHYAECRGTVLKRHLIIARNGKVLNIYFERQEQLKALGWKNLFIVSILVNRFDLNRMSDIHKHIWPC